MISLAFSRDGREGDHTFGTPCCQRACWGTNWTVITNLCCSQTKRRHLNECRFDKVEPSYWKRAASNINHGKHAWTTEVSAVYLLWIPSSTPRSRQPKAVNTYHPLSVNLFSMGYRKEADDASIEGLPVWCEIPLRWHPCREVTRGYVLFWIASSNKG